MSKTADKVRVFDTTLRDGEQTPGVTVTPDQKVQIAIKLDELGVDAIIGHHPHVAQPIELYRTRRDPARVVPIYYSLGNLTSPFSSPWLCRSQVARVRLATGRTSGGDCRTYVSEVEALEVEQVADERHRRLELVPRGVDDGIARLVQR